MNTNAHRKTSTAVRLINADGSSAAGSKVSAKLVRHEFLFGIGAFDLMAYLNVPDDMKDKFKSRAERWEALCNYGTLPFYWGRYEPEEGKTGKDGLMKTVDRMNELGAKVKGHPLCWHTVCADWLLKYSDEEIMAKQLARITREVNDFKGKIGLWDVINETVIMPVFDKYDNAVTRICNRYGRIPLIQKVFAAAHEADPDAVLLINDFNTSEEYAKVIEECLDAGVPIGAIGIQSHQHQGYWGAEKLERVLARFERFGLPIHFTENTIISGKLMPPDIVDLNDFHADTWDSTPEGEALQCEQLNEMYRILFSHPLVEAITGWEMTDGAWLNAPSGLLRRDGSPKPAYDMLMKLIHEEWSTRYTAPADDNGVFILDGYKGEYELEIDGKTYGVENNGNEAVIKL